MINNQRSICRVTLLGCPPWGSTYFLSIVRT